MHSGPGVGGYRSPSPRRRHPRPTPAPHASAREAETEGPGCRRGPAHTPAHAQRAYLARTPRLRAARPLQSQRPPAGPLPPPPPPRSRGRRCCRRQGNPGGADPPPPPRVGGLRAAPRPGKEFLPLTSRRHRVWRPAGTKRCEPGLVPEAGAGAHLPPPRPGPLNRASAETDWPREETWTREGRGGSAALAKNNSEPPDAGWGLARLPREGPPPPASGQGRPRRAAPVPAGPGKPRANKGAAVRACSPRAGPAPGSRADPP